MISYSCFILLKIDHQTDQDCLGSLPILKQQTSNIGDEIYCMNSGLSTFLYDYFSSSISKGVYILVKKIISSIFKKEIHFFDIRIVSYSQGALVFNNKGYYAALFPPLSVGRLNNLLGFGIELSNIFKRLNAYKIRNSKLVHNKVLNYYNQTSVKISNDSLLNNISDFIFIIYYGNTK